MLESEILIHIGYHKTATTFLQKRIFPALNFTPAMMPMDYIAESKRFNPEFLIQLLSEKYAGNGELKVISQESLTGAPEGIDIWNPYLIARRLNDTFPKAKILVVIRNQPAYILSLYTFRVVKKGLEIGKLTEYLEKKFESGLYEKLQYDKLIECYLNLFPKKNLLVIPYEQLVENEREFVNKIIRFMGMTSEIRYVSEKENVGTLNSEIILLSRLINFPFSVFFGYLSRKQVISKEGYYNIFKNYRQVKKSFINPALFKMLGRSSKKIDFDEKWKRNIIAAFRESNHKLKKLTDLDLEKYGYPW